MITIEQCRAARGLLDWTQQDLADASGLSKTAINNFEKGHSDIKYESLRAIRMAFESADIEFTGEAGLRKKTEDAQVLKGSGALGLLIDDIYATLENSDEELLASNVDESVIEQIKNKSLNGRFLCPQDTPLPEGKTDPYRWVSNDVFQAGIRTFIYGSKTAFQPWDSDMVVVVRSSEASDAEKGRFESLWAGASIAGSEQPKAADSSQAGGS